MAVFVSSIKIISRNFSTTESCCNKALGQRYGILSKLLKQPKKQSKTGKKPSLAPQGNDVIGVNKFLPTRPTRRQNVLNMLFMKHITDLMISDEISKDLCDLGIEILRVQVSADFTLANIFWISNDEKPESEVQALLDANSHKLRETLIGLQLVGTMPRLKFVQDTKHSSAERALKLIDSLGISNNTNYLDHLKETPVLTVHTEPDEETVTVDNLPHLSCTHPISEMAQNIYGLDHTSLMKKVMERSNKTKRQTLHNEKTSSVHSGKSEQYISSSASISKIAALLNKKKKYRAKDKNITLTDDFEYQEEDLSVEDEVDDYYEEEIDRNDGNR